MYISQISPNLNSYNNQKTCQNINFTSAAQSAEKVIKNNGSKFFEPIKKFFRPVSNFISAKYDKLVDAMAHGIGGIIGKDNVCEFFSRSGEIFREKLITHLMVLGSTILSALYVKKTLDNDKLDEQKKKTLAINQTAVWGVSTFLSYCFDGWANKGMNNFIRKFEEINKCNPGDLDKYTKGIKFVKTAVIMGTVYRYIAPVLVTPLANKIGNKLQEKKEAN